VAWGAITLAVLLVLILGCLVVALCLLGIALWLGRR